MVFGEGNPDCEVLFIGEAPGLAEDEQKRPFVGRSGQLLRKSIRELGWEEKDVYITNIVKDRPPDNRDPSPEEIKIYAPFLDRQIEAIKPEIIATLGRFSMAYVMEKFGLQKELKSISQIHGKIFEVKIPLNSVKIIPLYHPAATLYQNSLKKDLSEDFKIIKDLMTKKFI